jgi:hypothetical protein
MSANSPGIPTLSGRFIRSEPPAETKDAVQLVIGLGAQSTDRIVGWVELGRGRKSDSAGKILAQAASVGGGFVELVGAQFPDAVAFEPRTIELAAPNVLWVAKWDDFQNPQVAR